MMEIDDRILECIRQGNDTVPGMTDTIYPGTPVYDRPVKIRHVYGRLRHMMKYGMVEQVGRTKIPSGQSVVRWRVVE